MRGNERDQTVRQRFAWRHAHNDPHNILIVAKVFSDRLAQLDPENALEYHTRYLAFSTKWNDAIRRWEKKAIPLHDLAVIELRQSCAYLCRWLGIREVAKLESREFPSRGTATMRRAVAAAIRDRITMVVRGPYHSSAAVSGYSGKRKFLLRFFLCRSVRPAHGTCTRCLMTRSTGCSRRRRTVKRILAAASTSVRIAACGREQIFVKSLFRPTTVGQCAPIQS